MRFQNHAETARSLGALWLSYGLIVGLLYRASYVRIETLYLDRRDWRNGFRARPLQQRSQYYGGDSPRHKSIAMISSLVMVFRR